MLPRRVLMTALEDAVEAWNELFKRLTKPPESYADYQEEATKILKALEKNAEIPTALANQIEALANEVATLHADPTPEKLKGPTSGLRKLEAGMIGLRMGWYWAWLYMSKIRQQVEDLRPDAADPKAAAEAKTAIEKALAGTDHYLKIHASFSGVLRTLGETLSLGYEQVREETQEKFQKGMQYIGLSVTVIVGLLTILSAAKLI